VRSARFAREIERALNPHGDLQRNPPVVTPPAVSPHGIQPRGLGGRSGEIMKIIRSSFCALALACGLAASSHASADTITDFVAASGGEFDSNPFDYDILLNAVITADLADALANEDADLTLFAPNDLAFAQLAADLGCECKNEEQVWNAIVSVLTDLGEGDPIPVLTDILLYHVAPESLTFFDVIVASFFSVDIDTLQGATITPFFFRLIDNEPDLANPYLFLPFNVGTSNGIVHTIGRVLIPVDLS
jgi:uncharacterized surface protein with fasciclin (FAS1) repeats